jgi:Sigma-70, region 4
MVSDRNRQIIERRRSGESFSAIGSALGISRERVREIFEREERRDRRARELDPNFGLRDWEELKMWMERAGKSPAYQRGSGSRRSHDSR